MFKLALCQITGSAEKDRNIAKAEKFVREAASNGANVVALPEMWNCPYSNDYFRKFAEPADGRCVQFMSSLAKELGIYLIGGTIAELETADSSTGEKSPDSAAEQKPFESIELKKTASGGNHIESAGNENETGQTAEGGRVYNTSFCFDTEGNMIGRHRKVHLFDIDVKGRIRFMESDTLTAGNEMTVLDTEYGKIGVAICYDVRFPEWFRKMTLAGARLIVLPAAFNTTTGPVHWDITMQARAVDNQVYFAACAPARDEKGIFKAYGNSCIVDPWAQFIAHADEKECIIYGDIDFAKVESIREQLPLLMHRRPELY